ncbi:ImmA/IrrE family metallo-endopeptidase [Dactylosporangium salmoneum]|uniref:IrrE N-terminal-like domain-containing protein n=1 Tax=Dactylosporangium salmoneum TaxID=53361 RepID=A0ABP5V1I7_9ACTN
MNRSRQQLIDPLVPLMLAHLDDIGIDARDLAVDPVTVIPTVDNIIIDWVEPAALGDGCSVAALYSGTETPPRISVLRDASQGRRNFSLLHEFGHHLCAQVAEVSAALWKLPDGDEGPFEEDLVDEFAAAILLPADIVNQTFAQGVTAAAVLQLWRHTTASREACCVAAARHLSAPGYVMLVEPGGRSQFAARQGDVLPIARDSRQSGTRLRAAVRAGIARGVDRPTYASGVAGQQMYLDARTTGGYTFAVWVTDSPAWQTLLAPLDAGPVGHDGHCSDCGKDFQTWKKPCSTCGEPFCPDCGACDCAPGGRRPVANRICTSCFQSLPLAAFDGGSTTCNQH